MKPRHSRAVYFDCFSGISGDMILGALVDLGADLGKIRKGLATLDLTGYTIRSRSVKKHGISGTKVEVGVKPVKGKRSPARKLKDIQKIIEASKLPAAVRKNAVAIFQRLGRAEAKVHRTAIDKIHFHEVGAVDSIVDIVGGVYAMELLNVERVFASPLNVGEGFVECEHGTLPVPAPATLELLHGVPCFSSGVRKELTTPTGAAMIGHWAEGFQPLPQMAILKTGYGAGDHDVPQTPNLLRAVLGEMPAKSRAGTVQVVETNIDDMNPEFYDHAMDSLFKAGALDVWLEPIVMKKSRPAVKLSALVPEKKREAVIQVLLAETSTFGVRFFPAERTTLARTIETVKTPHGPVRVKVGTLGDAVRKIVPEYEDCKKIARKEKRPVQAVYQEILKIAADKLD